MNQRTEILFQLKQFNPSTGEKKTLNIFPLFMAIRQHLNDSVKMYEINALKSILI